MKQTPASRQSRVDLAPEVREALVNLLAQMLVEDYQQSQEVGRATVVEGPVRTRGPKRILAQESEKESEQI